MQREITSWYSPSLNKEMPIATYGNYGFALLLIQLRLQITWNMNASS